VKMRISRLKLILLMAMSVFGLGASSEVLITYYFLKQSLPYCTAGSFSGIRLDCNVVLGSRYSQVFGVPLELFAVAYFVVNLLLVYVIAFGKESLFRRAVGILFVWRFIGLMIVPYLVFIELFVLNAICVYCTIMHLAIVTDFVVISYLLFYRGGLGTDPEPGVPDVEAEDPSRLP
jgi:uncharacterized membrane protein